MCGLIIDIFFSVTTTVTSLIVVVQNRRHFNCYVHAMFFIYLLNKTFSIHRLCNEQQRCFVNVAACCVVLYFSICEKKLRQVVGCYCLKMLLYEAVCAISSHPMLIKEQIKNLRFYLLPVLSKSWNGGRVQEL